MKKYILLFSFLVVANLTAQNKIEDDLSLSYRNAVKGIYWALENIPVKKMNLDNDLISENKLYANVKLSKEINGIKIRSTGFDNTYEISIILFRSYDSLEKDGYIKKEIEEVKKEEEEK